MERTVLGKTGLEAYRLGLGGIPIQRVSEAQAVETVYHAVQQGLDFIDTARVYTTSERRIGLALQQTDRKVILASKCRGRSADEARADLETSLRELQRDYVDLYMCHFVATDEEYQKVISKGGALEALNKAAEEGLIGHTGITSHSLEVLDRSLEDGLFETIMVCFSFLEPRARESIIPKAIEKNVGVMAMKPFSGGVIEDAGLALKYVLSVPEILVVAGVERPDLFDQDWRLFREGHSLTDAEQAEIAEMQRGYDKVFCRRCDYCQPCPEEIPIQLALGIRSLVKRMGKDLVQNGPLAGAVEKARNCSECGECVARCPYELPVPDMIRENLRWFDEEVA